MTDFQRYTPSGWVDRDGLLIEVLPPPKGELRRDPCGVHSAALLVTLSALLLGTSAATVQITTSSGGANTVATSRPPPTRALFGEFVRLVSELQTDCAFSSSTTEWVEPPACKRMVYMGEAAVPFRLGLLDEPGEWAIGLMRITGDDPGGSGVWGDKPAMARAWKEWAARQQTDDVTG